MKSISFFSKYIVRTPTFSYDEVDKVLSSLSCFEQIISNSIFAEAIFIASQSLYKRIYQQNIGKMTKEDIDRIQLSIVKYFSRMSVRSTPFGLFAACSVGGFSSGNSFTIKKDVSRVIRLDHSVLCKIAEVITSPENCADNHIMYYPNTSLYRVFGNKARYVEPSQGKEGGRQYLLEEIILTDYLIDVLNSCHDGASLVELSNMIKNKYGTDYTESIEFLHDLVRSKIIVPELYYSVTGDDYLNRIINLPFLRNTRIKKTLNSIKWHTLNDESGIVAYTKIQKKLSSIGWEKIDDNLIQIDLVRSSKDFLIGEKLQNDIKEVFYLLRSISPKKNLHRTMEQFKNKFSEVYQLQEIPLVLALDPDIGIGYPVGATRATQSSMMDYVEFPNLNNENETSNIVNRFLENNIAKTIAENQKEIDLTSIFNKIRIDEDDLLAQCPEYSSFFTKIRPFILNNSGEVIIELSSFHGNSALNIINRFAHTSPEIMTICKEIASWENNLGGKDSIIAEIVHLPEDRVGNVTYRPLLRDYEIPYISSASTSRDCTLNIEDLYISIVNNRLKIRSKRLNKWVIPRLSNAHNFVYSKLPIYRFLCDYQSEISDIQAFSPKPSNLKSSTFFPRLKYKNIILSLASWHVDKKDFEHIFDINDDCDLLFQISQWRKHNNIPNRILLCQGDNELYVNLSIPKSIRAFISSVKKSSSFLIKEFSYPNTTPAIMDENGKRYCGEVFVFLKIKDN